MPVNFRCLPGCAEHLTARCKVHPQVRADNCPSSVRVRENLCRPRVTGLISDNGFPDTVASTDEHDQQSWRVGACGSRYQTTGTPLLTPWTKHCTRHGNRGIPFQWIFRRSRRRSLTGARPGSGRTTTGREATGAHSMRKWWWRSNDNRSGRAFVHWWGRSPTNCESPCRRGVDPTASAHRTAPA